jgi:hypothetical protein
MTLFPDVQKKAQAEINAVVGTDRFPSFEDRDSLPYIEALVKEVLRWNAVAPTGLRSSYHFHCGAVSITQRQESSTVSLRTISMTDTTFQKVP